MKTKTKSNRSKQFNCRLAAYSATAGVALMAAPAAQATIFNITSFEYGSLSAFTTEPPDVTGNSTNINRVAFIAATAGHSRGMLGALSAGHQTDFGGATRNVASIANAGSGVVATGYLGSTRAKDFIFGSHIMGNNLVSPALLAEKGLNAAGNPRTIGSFLPNGNSAAKTGYIGFKSGSYYGWLRVKVVNDSSGLPLEVTLAGKDGIYGAIGLPGDNLTAGETAGMSPVPDQASTLELSGLALLALGAFGVREQRRRRQPTGTR